MDEHRLTGLALTIVLGIAAQWLGWRARLPAILLLLIVGFVAGPVTHLFDPDEVFGGLLFPIISFAVAVILFEGGLSLRLDQLPQVGAVLGRLLSVGALTTWVVGTLGARFLVGIQDWGVALLLGAILIVTGPTVIGPLLRHVRPTSKLASILNWEGIVIDPIGAVLAVIVFEAIVGHSDQSGWQFVALSIGKTLLFGGGVGLVAAGMLATLLRKFWIPDELQNPAVLAFVAGGFAFSNHLQAESGLVAVTLMGVILANQKWIAVGHIVEFKENLRVLLISGLFIILAARLKVEQLREIGFGSVVFLALMVFVARPLSVYLSTIGTKVTRQERLFLMWMAPRGIVAAAVASIFSQRLMQEEFEGARAIVPVTVVIIVGTVALYGLTASFVAQRLGIAKPRPNGVLMVGAHDWARRIAEALKKAGIGVLLVDTDLNNIAAAKMAGLSAQHTSIMSKIAHETAEEGEYGRLIALTRNDEVNALACQHYIELFGRAGVFQLSFKRAGHARHESVSPNQRGRLIFDRGTSWTQLNEAFAKGATVKATKLSEEFTYEDFRDRYGVYAIPLFVITLDKELYVIAPDTLIEPGPDDTLISLIPGEKAQEEKVEKVEKRAEEVEKKAEKVVKAVEKEKAKEAEKETVAV